MIWNHCKIVCVSVLLELICSITSEQNSLDDETGVRMTHPLQPLITSGKVIPAAQIFDSLLFPFNSIPKYSVTYLNWTSYLIASHGWIFEISQIN